MSYKEKYNNWLTNNYMDESTKAELLAIKDKEDEIKERFYKDLEFGTGGLRGIMGAGTNRLNIYVIRKATQGFANYLKNKKSPVKEMSVCIAYDSRNMSKEFAEEVALVFNGNGIKTYTYSQLKPTPQLSFSIRHLGCVGGVMLTASHNPPEYNGYKVYGEDGAQIPYPQDNEIIRYVNEIEDFNLIKVLNKTEAINKGLYNILDKDIDEKYLDTALSQSINSKIIKDECNKFKIVYTPLHGTGNKPVRRLLEKAGFKNVIVVPEQELPDGDFTTVKYPNPEDPKAFNLAIKLATKVDADIIIGTDPDADRVGAVYKNRKGEYITLNGNMIGILLTNYILSEKHDNNQLPKNAAVVSSLVSTGITKEVCKEYNVRYFEVLTGFKYIGKLIKEFEAENNFKYIFGFEESYGYLSGTYSRDKDAVCSAMLICEMTAYYKSKNMYLCEVLEEIYKKHGYYKESTEAINLKGLDGISTIERIMQYFADNYPKEINGIKVVELRDYNKRISKNLITNKEVKINSIVSNVLYFTLEDNTWICIRPSGTEPKLKVYFGVKGSSHDEAKQKLDTTVDYIMKIINNLQ